jgi:Asp-tRNA(Asn)/Glu-tRNA(Gln) amidotransferase A subunit family amidase
LDRLAAVDGRLRAFVPEPDRAGRVLAEARRQDGESGERPLRGVPVAVKDVYHVAGLPTRAGSALDPRLLTGPESELVRRVRTAGAVVLGKTHLDEFACSEPGPTRNPHDLTRTPGGSSAGSAAAVAAGICPVALGSQTQRSVIGPAAYCGVVGYKPGLGLVPYDGVPMAPSIDTVGLLTADLPTLARAAAAILGVRPGAVPAAPVLAVPDGRFLDPVEPGARGAFEAQLQRLAAAGAELRWVEPPWEHDLSGWLSTLEDALLGELARVHEPWFPRYEHLYRPRTAAAVRAGAAVSASRLAAAHRRIAGLRPAVEAALHDADCWVCPSSTGPAPRGLHETGRVETTLFWSWAGLPCLSLPAGRAVPADGGAPMPVGLQCVGRHGADRALIGVARWVAAALDPSPPDREEVA